MRVIGMSVPFFVTGDSPEFPVTQEDGSPHIPMHRAVFFMILIFMILILFPLYFSFSGCVL